MFKSFSAKSFMLMLLALTMSACATISGHPVAESADKSQLVTLPPLTVEPIVFIPKPIKLEVPELKAQALPVPILGLSDRARVVISEAEIQCMAKAIYFEARGEVTQGKIGVGYVILNRMGHHKFPKTTCGVVYEQNRRGCQFSWVCDGVADRIVSPKSYEQAKQIAVSVLKREVENPVDDSIFFREKSIKSRYASSQRHVTSIGQHKFFAALE
jgi:Cell Wall Hydrolase